MQNKVPKTYTILTVKLFLCLKFSTVKVKKKWWEGSAGHSTCFQAWQPDSWVSFLVLRKPELTLSRCPLTSTGVPRHLWMRVHVHILSHGVQKKIPFQNIIKFLHILSQSYIFGGDSRLRVILQSIFRFYVLQNWLYQWMLDEDRTEICKSVNTAGNRSWSRKVVLLVVLLRLSLLSTEKCVLLD